MNSAPEAFARRTLRAWAVYSALYGVLGALMVVWLLPWKSPGWNVGLLAYAFAHMAAAPGLFRGRRWGWRLALGAGFVGIILAMVLMVALVGSWAYLRAIYGDFGRGASIGALLFGGVAVQILGLYPALLVRALLRREVRALTGGRHWIKALVGLAVVPILVVGVVHATFRMQPIPPVSTMGQQQAISHLRAALDGAPRPGLDALANVPVGVGPLHVTLWWRGRAALRVIGEGVDLAAAVTAAGDALAAADTQRFKGARLKVDRLVASGPVPSEAPMAVALSVDPGRDGLRRVGAESRILLPDDLLKRQLFGAAPLVPGIKELRLGLNAKPALETLGSDGRLERIRAESWVEYKGLALSVARANTPGPTGPEAWRAAAIAGGDFVLRQLKRDGRFHYQYFPMTNHHPKKGGAYSIPRHAGTVYALALLYGHTGASRYKRGAERAIAWLDTRIPKACGAPERGCVVRGGVASLGGAALTMVGMLEYQRQTKDARYAATVRRLAEFVLMLQKPAGDFHHLYWPRADRIDTETVKMFYSEEAALALTMAHEVLGDEKYLKAAERALDFLTRDKYEKFFLGGFIYGADHWTCIAAEAAWPRLKNPRYLSFCKGYASFIGRLQYEPTGWPEGFAGHYGFSALMVPQAPAAAGFTEAIISTRELAQHHGEDTPTLDAQVAAALDVLTRDQIRADNAWMMPSPSRAKGGIRRSLVEQEVRIDFTQHALTALTRGASAWGVGSSSAAPDS